MIRTMFCLFDSKIGAYMQPFFCVNKGEAIRGFAEAINSGDTNLAKYPEDFTLFELGTFDDQTAKFVLYPTPTTCGKAIEFKKYVPVKE